MGLIGKTHVRQKTGLETIISSSGKVETEEYLGLDGQPHSSLFGEYQPNDRQCLKKKKVGST